MNGIEKKKRRRKAGDTKQADPSDGTNHPVSKSVEQHLELCSQHTAETQGSDGVISF